MKVSICWFRRDLRLSDNSALHHALASGKAVIPLFIFDTHILDELPANDARVTFIYDSLERMHDKLQGAGSGMLVMKGQPIEVWKQLLLRYDISEVSYNRDYEPYATERDAEVKGMLEEKGIEVQDFKDQLIFEKSEVAKKDGKPYTVFTHYKKKWLLQFDKAIPLPDADMGGFLEFSPRFPKLEELGFKRSQIRVVDPNYFAIKDYALTRDFPSAGSTTMLGPHLRFGTIGIRQLISGLKLRDEVFLGELIWREFFMQILYHFPKVVDQNYNRKYDSIAWRNREDEFELWREGKTGYPFVDAGMRELKESGYMHNRVRMAVASFLCKHLLIDWRWGEAWFAEKLLDYELSSNNGNWQWAAGTGCDAAPYFRVFNPITQHLKFDKEMTYTRKWIPEYETPDYPEPMVEHSKARKRALDVYRKAVKN